jgi:hypothetical protein
VYANEVKSVQGSRASGLSKDANRKHSTNTILIVLSLSLNHLSTSRDDSAATYP